MELVKFMNAHKKDWKEILSADPYNIKISSMPALNGTYYLLKYNQLSSDFNLAFCREARGCIMYFDNLTQRFECVCHPFDKFGNYGESYVPEIDWKNAKVTEKVDGSLIKVWYHGGWHISTNGTIDAHYAYVPNTQLSYYDLFLRALRRNNNYPTSDFFAWLDKSCVYMFELVSPDNRMTILYPDDTIYLIGVRDKYGQEHDIDGFKLSFGRECPMIKFPKTYYLHTLEDCIRATQLMGADEEGFVVCDAKFNRVKVKSEQYLIASRLRFNNSITTKKVIKIIREGILDDFVAYNTDYKEKVDLVMQAGRAIAATMELCWEQYQIFLPATKKEFFEMARKSKYCDFYCKKYDNKFPITAEEWLHRQPIDTITEWVDEMIVALLVEEAKDDL